jgi:hypothetical protein
MKRLTPEQKAEMIELYTSGQIKIPRLLDEKYGIYHGSCYFILKRRNLIKYSNAAQHRLFNENYFENIVTEKQAYFLGLLAADGNVSNKRNTISLSLNVDDGLDLIEEFKKELNSTGSIKIYTDKRTDHKRKSMATIQFTSQKTKEDLQKIGLGPKKTTDLAYPKINKELDKHFIRGFIDGDGSFHYKREILVFSLVGTKSILESIQQILEEELEITPRKLMKHVTGVYYLSLAHKNTLKLREWIYKDCSIAMKRKRNYTDRK